MTSAESAASSRLLDLLHRPNGSAAPEIGEPTGQKISFLSGKNISGKPMKWTGAILLSTLCIGAWPVASATGQELAMTGHDRQDRCHDALRLIEDPGRVPPDSPDFADATLCLGFVQGVGDTGALLAELDVEEVAALRNCKPARATAEQVTRLLMRHLEDRPEDANLPGAAIVLITLRDAFPCNG